MLLFNGRKSPSYQVVELSERNIAGISLRTSNADPAMQADIGALWEQVFKPQVSGSIAGKTNGTCIGLYTNAASGEAPSLRKVRHPRRVR